MSKEVNDLPIKIPDSLPARKILENENIFVMTELRANTQDIRPLKIAILNLMPKKIETETQLLRMLGNTPIQVDIELLQTTSHVSKNTSSEHLLKFYKTLDDVKDQRFDGLIITGAPVEQIPFEEVDYWPELCRFFDWANTHVYSTLSICWGAQAALYYYYNIPKYPLQKKMFGIFEHCPLHQSHRLLRGFDERFFVPHSRHTCVRKEDIEAVDDLIILTESAEAGVHLIASRDNRRFFVTGHGEYDRETLSEEYYRDFDKGLPIEVPAHYFPGDDPSKTPPLTWRSHASLLYSNWLNYFVYQSTPYNLEEL